jgi:hypothetical protein
VRVDDPEMRAVTSRLRSEEAVMKAKGTKAEGTRKVRVKDLPPRDKAAKGVKGGIVAPCDRSLRLRAR